MDFTQKVILTNMCMLCSGTRVLVQDRVDSRWKGVAFPGGHVEKDESLTQAVIREVFEETGLTVKKPRLKAVKNWINDDGSRYIVLLYTASEYEGELHDSEEGRNFWVEKDALASLPLAPDMEATLRACTDADVGELFYKDEDCEWTRYFF